MRLLGVYADHIALQQLKGAARVKQAYIGEVAIDRTQRRPPDVLPRRGLAVSELHDQRCPSSVEPLTNVHVPHAAIQVRLLRGGNGNVVVAAKDQPIAQLLKL